MIEFTLIKQLATKVVPVLVVIIIDYLSDKYN